MSIIPKNDREIKPTIPDHRWDQDKPVNFTVDEGMRYINSEMLEYGDESVDLDVGEPTSGNYTDLEQYIFTHPEVVSSLREEYAEAERAVCNAMVRCDLGKPVKSNFIAASMFLEHLPKGLQEAVGRAVTSGSFTSEDWEEFSQIELSRSFRAALVGMAKASSAVKDPDPFEALLRQAVLRADEGHWEDLSGLSQSMKSTRSATKSLLQEKFVRLARTVGPGSPYFKDREDYLRKLKAWVISYGSEAL